MSLFGLDEGIYARVVALSEEGNALAGGGFLPEATDKYREALELLPEPREQWELSTWLYAAIGEVAFKSGDYSWAGNAFASAARCPGALENPFIRLRRGQALFELGDLEAAGAELAAAHALDGAAIFDGEPAKYLEHYLKSVKPPDGSDQMA